MGEFKEEDFKRVAPIADHIHFYGLYLGNYPDLTPEEIDSILQVIKNV